MTDAGRVGAGAGGPQWGGSAEGLGTVLTAPHRDPPELPARPGYVADTGAAGRAGLGSICGRRGPKEETLGPTLPRVLPLNLPSSIYSSTLTLFKLPEIWESGLPNMKPSF